MSEVLQAFQKHLLEWKKLQNFIDKTREKTGKFSEAVIAKLVIEFETKQDILRDEIEPLVETMQEALQTLENDLAELKRNNSSYDEVEQELSLRYEIGAIKDQEYQAELDNLRSSMVGYAEKSDALNAGIEELSSGLAEWYSARGYDEESPEVKKDQKTQGAPQSQKDQKISAVQDEESEDILEEIIKEVPVEQETLISSEMDAALQKTLTPNFDDELPPVPFDEDDSEDFEVPPSIDDFEVAKPEDFSSPLTTLDGEELNFDLSDNDLGFEESVEFSAELVSPDEFSSSIEISSIDLMANPLADEPRTAILLRDEGTPNEAVFPFQGDTYGIGRSAENNIQIKGDNKVSRMHCKLTRRENQFYIQDLGSSNGTVVDGELIHEERKLLGGEELKVGETIFRFQIQ